MLYLHPTPSIHPPSPYIPEQIATCTPAPLHTNKWRLTSPSPCPPIHFTSTNGTCIPSPIHPIANIWWVDDHHIRCVLFVGSPLFGMEMPPLPHLGFYKDGILLCVGSQNAYTLIWVRIFGRREIFRYRGELGGEASLRLLGYARRGEVSTLPHRLYTKK